MKKKNPLFWTKFFMLRSDRIQIKQIFIRLQFTEEKLDLKKSRLFRMHGSHEGSAILHVRLLNLTVFALRMRVKVQPCSKRVEPAYVL